MTSASDGKPARVRFAGVFFSFTGLTPAPARRSVIYLRNGRMRSMGSGKMSVEFFSEATSVSVCK